MCGRFAFWHGARELQGLFGADVPPLDPRLDAPRYNVAPTQDILAVRHADGRREVAPLRWGLVPHWVKKPEEFRASTINARSETAATQASYRDPFRRRRCLVPMSGFYEWRREGERKQPYFIRRADDRPLAAAGLWDRWQGAGRTIESVTILTTTPNDVMRPIHDRMPVFLEPDDWTPWLENGTEAAELEALLGPCDPGRLRAYPVRTTVNSPRNDGAQLVEPVEPAA